MCVRVDEAWNDRLSRHVDDARAGGHGELAAAADGCDAIARHDHDAIVDDRTVVRRHRHDTRARKHGRALGLIGCNVDGERDAGRGGSKPFGGVSPSASFGFGADGMTSARRAE